MINKVNYDRNKKDSNRRDFYGKLEKKHEGYGLGHDTQGKYGK